VKRSAGTDSASIVFVGTDCEEDYDDLRFTKADGVTLLDYWIEAASASEATVWVELNSLPGETTTNFRLFYGNSAAAAVSNGDATFTFFDDFSGSSGAPNTNKWDVVKRGSTSAVAALTGSGDLQLAGLANNNTSGNVISKTALTRGVSIEYRDKISNANYAISGFGSGTTQDELGGSTNWWLTYLPNGYAITSISTSDKMHEIAPSAARSEIALASASSLYPQLDTYYRHKITWDSSDNIKAFLNDSEILSANDNTYASGNKYIHFSQGEYSDGRGGNRYIDWVFARTKAATEPTVTAWVNWIIVTDTCYLYFPAETGGVEADITGADTGYVRHSAETSALEAAITGTDIAYLYFLLEYGTLKFLKFAEDIGYLYAIEWTATIRNLVTGSDIGYLYFSTEDSPAPVVHVTAADTGYIRFTEIASLAAAISAADTLYLNPDIETLDIIALLYAEDTLYLAPDVESSIVHNVFNICNESRRRISARVEITYTDPFSEEGVITVTAPDFSYPSHSDDIVDGKYEVPGKWFSFSDNLLDGNSLLCLEPSETKGKYSVGWWSDDLSDENGEFDPGLMITMEFPARPVFFLKMYGDTELGGYPVDYEYKLYGVDDVLLARHTVTANDDPTWRYELIELPSSPGEEVPDPVFDVVKITFEVTKISAPLAQCRIIELFTAYTETYESDELFGISLLEEMDYESGTVPIGNISSNQITVSLHNEDRRFDPSNPESPIRTMMLKHRRIKAWLGVEITEEVGLEWYPLGVFYSMDWSSPDNSPVTTVMGLDRLELLRNSDFAPYEIFADYSLGALAETILTDAGLLEAEYVIDPDLYGEGYVVPYAWFNRMTHRYALQKVAENALGFVFCDRYGRIHIERYAPTDTTITTFTRDDYYSRDHPLRWNEMVNVVEVAATPRVQSEKKELYSDTEEFVVTAGTQAERFYMFKETPAYGDLTVTLYCVGEGMEYDTTDYPWAIRFWWINDTGSDITVTGIKIEGYVLEKRGGLIAEARDDISIRQNGRVGLRYPIELEFIQTRAQAQVIADALVLMYADPQKDVMLNARGHIWTQLGDRIGVSNYQDDIAENYAIVRQSIDWAGSLRAQITARKITGGSIFSPAHGGLGYYWE
jgi:hypothetical protein